MEMWQEKLAKQGSGEASSNTKEWDNLDDRQKDFIKKIIDHNQTMNGELRGILVNGEEVRGVESAGWGSNAKVEIDEKTGQIKKVADRFMTKSDKVFVNFYLTALENQFKRMDEEAKIMSFEKEMEQSKNNKFHGESPDCYN